MEEVPRAVRSGRSWRRDAEARPTRVSPVERYIALNRLTARNLWLRELERTLHVLGDGAVALSSFEVREADPQDLLRGVSVLRLRKARGTWDIEGVTSRPIAQAVTIRRTLVAVLRPTSPSACRLMEPAAVHPG